MTITIQDKEKALRESGFFVGGLTDEGIETWYAQMIEKTAQIKERTRGISKKEIARQMDITEPSFNYSAESGPTSYKNYTRDEMLATCLDFNIDPVSEYRKSRQGIL